MHICRLEISLREQVRSYENCAEPVGEDRAALRLCAKGTVQTMHICRLEISLREQVRSYENCAEPVGAGRAAIRLPATAIVAFKHRPLAEKAISKAIQVEAVKTLFQTSTTSLSAIVQNFPDADKPCRQPLTQPR